jgi:FG-GAP-like repeat
MAPESSMRLWPGWEALDRCRLGMGMGLLHRQIVFQFLSDRIFMRLLSPISTAMASWTSQFIDSSADNVYIILGNGDGTFGPLSKIAVGNDSDARAAGDFNNDGRLDLAIVNFQDNTVTLLLGNGDGMFTQALGSPYPVRKGAYQIVAADFNGHGELDLAVANLTDGTVSILLQQ